MTEPVIQLPDLYGKLAAVVGQLGYIKKTGRNDFQRYDYMTAEALLGEVRGPLADAGIVLLSSVTDITEREYTTSKDKASVLTTVRLHFTFIDSATGQKHECDWAGVGDDPADKGLGKAYTNAIKTFLRQQLLIPQGDDPEADSETDKRGADRSRARPAAPPKQAIPAAVVHDLATALRGLGLKRGEVRTWLMATGLEDVPTDVDPVNAIGALTEEQANALAKRIEAHRQKAAA